MGFILLTNQLLDQEAEERDEAPEEGAAFDMDTTRKGKSAVIKTSTRQTIFLPIAGLVPTEQLKPGDLVGVNKDSYLILDTLPAEYVSDCGMNQVDHLGTTPE